MHSLLVRISCNQNVITVVLKKLESFCICKQSFAYVRACMINTKKKANQRACQMCKLQLQSLHQKHSAIELEYNLPNTHTNARIIPFLRKSIDGDISPK